MARLEAEVAGQPAAARVQDLQVDARRAQQRLVRVVAHDGVLVAVGLRYRLPAQVRRLPAVGVIPQQFGRIIMISSVEGKHGKPAIPAYVTCKHAMIGLAKSIAKENGTSGITCNAICPGLVWTDVLVATGPDSAKEMGLTFEQMVDLFAQETALKRISTVEEVAAVAVLLASDVAGGITGSAYNVDGGTAAY